MHVGDGRTTSKIQFLEYFTIFVVMEAKYWYIIVGAIYLLSRFLKKPDQKEAESPEAPPQPTARPGSRPPREPQKSVTFEELLREIAEAKESRKAEVPSAKRVERPEYVDYDDDLKNEEQSLETLEDESDYRRKDTSYQEYERAKAMAFNRPSLEETMKLSDSKIEFGKFKEFEAERSRNLLNEYTKAFQDPQGLRAAIVMSEILNRKF